jgi:hypothetical protein
MRVVTAALSREQGEMVQLRNTIQIAQIEKNVVRPGFSNRFHRVTFQLEAEGSAGPWFQVWVDLAYHENDLERVAYSILSSELDRLAKDAKRRARWWPKIGSLSKIHNATARRVKARSKRRAGGRHARHVGNDVRIVRYILEGTDALPCEDISAWKAQMEKRERWIGDTAMEDANQCPVRICTVFLGLDMNFGVGEPVLFETTVLGGHYDRELYRYCTWQEAATGHAIIVERIKAPKSKAKDNPHMLRARALAQQTVQLSGKEAIRKVLEQAEKDAL